MVFSEHPSQKQPGPSCQQLGFLSLQSGWDLGQVESGGFSGPQTPQAQQSAELGGAFGSEAS